MKRNNAKQEELSIAQIRAKLQDGDHALIAEVTDYSPVYVRSCLAERRNNPLIITVAEALIRNREAFVRDIKKIALLIRQDKFKPQTV